MSDYDFNSSACLECIKKIIIELSSGITSKMLTSILKINNPQQILNDLVSCSTNTLIGCVDCTWEKYRIPLKMMHLKQLTETSPPETAWRPKTGEVNSNCIIAKALLEKKALLEEQIAIVKAESDEINKYMEENHEKLQHQLCMMKTNSVEGY